MLLLLFCLWSVTTAVVVETPLGKIEGFTHTTESGSSANVFLGVRYAQKPTGKLRYEKPVMVEPWSDTLDAKAFGPVCYPHHKFGVLNGTSEDCLSVNFIVPAKQDDKKLPVFVFIHGGGYVMGDARAHGYNDLTENYATQGIIAVTIQYRLGFLGFFSNGDDIPGNLGLWDQTMALKFIRKIVPAFGGDVDQITIGGLSAGSASVTQLLISPHANNLFSQAIQFSGSGLADWAYSDRVIADSLKFSNQLGCRGKNVKKCLQEKSIDELVEATTQIEGYRKHWSMFQYQPRFDGDFFPEDIHSLFEKAPKKKTMQGVTYQENLLFTAIMNFPFNSLYVDEERRKTFGEEDVKNLLKLCLWEEEFGEQTDALTSWVHMSYADLAETQDSSFYFHRYTDLGSDVMFNIPIHQEVQYKTQNDWETYYFVTDYITESMPDFTGFRKGATHGDEIRYLMEMNGFVLPIPFTEEDKRFQDVLLSAVVNFIKNGTPSTETVKWLSTTVENSGRHLRMNSNPEMTEEVFRGAAAKLWLEKLPQLFGEETARKILPGIPLRKIVHQEL